MFTEIKDQDKAIRMLLNSIKNNRVAQAYLFHGPEGVGKFTAALYFGMAINCLSSEDKCPCGVCLSCRKYLDLSHPDMVYIFPTPNIKLSDSGDMNNQAISEYSTYIENRKNTPWQKIYFSTNAEIRKGSIEILQKKLEFTQREGRYRFCIIEDADEMNPNTANSFLKTLEEPPDNTVLVLLTSNMQSMLTTVVSRCQLIYFQPLTNKTIEEILIAKYHLDKQSARTYSNVSNGNLEKAIRLALDIKHESKKLMITFIESALNNNDSIIISLFTGSKDKHRADFIHDLLYHFALFVNDLSSVNTNMSEFSNTEYLQLLQTYSEKNSEWVERCHSFLLFLDKLHKNIDGNVNVNLILINLYFELKSFLKV
jgi:DNA polymerase-3 subunit delta'